MNQKLQLVFTPGLDGEVLRSAAGQPLITKINVLNCCDVSGCHKRRQAMSMNYNTYRRVGNNSIYVIFVCKVEYIPINRQGK